MFLSMPSIVLFQPWASVDQDMSTTRLYGALTDVPRTCARGRDVRGWRPRARGRTNLDDEDKELVEVREKLLLQPERNKWKRQRGEGRSEEPERKT